MKTEFDRYLKQIGISELFYERSKHVVEVLRRVIGEDVLDIFVSDYFDGEGKRNYQDLLLFTQHRIVEVKQFLTQDQYFINNVQEYPIVGIEINANEYDFEKATEKSRLNLKVFWGEGTSLNLPMKAAGENCDYLNGIFKKYFLQTTAKSTVSCNRS